MQEEVGCTDDASADKSWCACHLFYDGDRNHVLLRFVLPVWQRLCSEEGADRFFFVRYALEGPHVRLRLRIPEDRQERVRLLLREMAAIFSESLEELDETLLGGRRFHMAPCEFEVERYGGPEFWWASLEYFTVSSVEALHFVARHGEEGKSRQLAEAFRLLARQAWSFARDRHELLGLFDYFAGWRDSMMSIVARADELFERKSSIFCTLLFGELEELVSAQKESSALREEDLFRDAGRRLDWDIRSADEATRQQILTSHLHMTANRLGLNNADEVYLSQLLCRAADKLLKEEPAFQDFLEGLQERDRTLGMPRRAVEAALRSLQMPAAPS